MPNLFARAVRSTTFSCAMSVWACAVFLGMADTTSVASAQVMVPDSAPAARETSDSLASRPPATIAQASRGHTAAGPLQTPSRFSSGRPPRIDGTDRDVLKCNSLVLAYSVYGATLGAVFGAIAIFPLGYFALSRSELRRLFMTTSIGGGFLGLIASSRELACQRPGT